MSYASSSNLFSGIPEKRPPWKEFVFGMGTQAVLVVAVAWIGILHPEIIVEPARDYHVTQLVETPVPLNLEPAPLRVFKTEPVVAENPPVAVLRVPPAIHRAIPQPSENTPAPQVQVAETKPLPMAPTKAVIPRQLVKTEVFSTGSSANPTLAAAPSKVQTGGFGDPNGVPARDTGKAVNIAQAGSFNLPSGPGYGNGTGGAHGAAGVVASAGFGSGTAIGDGSGRANITRGNVRQSGFGDTDPNANVNHPKQAEAVAAAPKTLPAEVLSKPNPAYTSEARSLKIEGEVLLEVVFESNGKVHVNRVIRGLGHGLDEAAIRAAEEIHFRPAVRDGQPADSTAVLHIVFQLA